MKWKQVGDQCSKEFFRAYKQRSSASHNTELEDQNGQIYTDQPELANVCHAYYQKIYKARETPIVAEATQTHALGYLSNRLSMETKANLGLPITKEELYMAMKDMANGKALGPDGIILEFYSVFWELIGHD